VSSRDVDRAGKVFVFVFVARQDLDELSLLLAEEALEFFTVD